MVGKKAKKKGTKKKQQQQVIVIKEEDYETKLSHLQSSIVEEEQEIGRIEKQIYDLEEGHFLETLLTGNVVNGWGNPQESLGRFRYDAIQKKKTLKTGTVSIISEKQQLDLDKSRIFSFSSVNSPGEELYKTLVQREEAWQIAQDKKEAKKLKNVLLSSTTTIAAASTNSDFSVNKNNMVVMTEATV
jgi:hypothetical protein